MGAYNSGILVSNKQQKVVAEEDIIRILPADPKTVSIPKYDPEALLAAIEPPEVVEEELPIPAPEKAAAPAAQPAAPAATSEAPAPAPTAAPAAAPAAEAVYTEAPAYAPAPYTGPPMVSYAEPQTSFWESAATFAGGAVVGGLLGYAISDGDDWFDDDDHDGHGGRNINIEDSTVVVGGGRYDRDRVQNELRNRRGTTDRARSRQQVGDLKAGDWKKGGVAPTRQTAGRSDGATRAAKKKNVRLPMPGRNGR